MARYDKYEPFGGGFRAPLAANFVAGDIGVAFGVGLDVNGRIVKGAGNTGIVGILILTRVRSATDVVDVMTDGEIVEAGLLAGTVYYADNVTGAITAVATAATRLGHTVEGGRLVARAAR